MSYRNTVAMALDVKRKILVRALGLGVAVCALLGGAAQAQAAAVTWLDSWAYNNAYSALSDGNTMLGPGNSAFLGVPGAAALGTHTLTAGEVSATFTNTSSGFSISGNGNAWGVEAIRYFTISGLTGSETVTGTFNLLPSVPAGGGFAKWNPNLYGGVWDSTFSTLSSTTVQLSNGTYHVSLAVGMDEGSYQLFSFGNGETVAEFAVVPLPAAAWAGIVMLGGLAGTRGLKSLRRRRA